MKKLFVLLLSLVLVFSLIGCGKTNESGSDAAKEETPAAEETPATEEEASDDGEEAEEPAKEDQDTAVAEDDLFVLRAFTPTTFMEFTIADEMGFFRDGGIQIQYVGSLPTGMTDLQLIEQGEIDVSYSGHPSVVAQARLSGIKVKMIAPGMVDDEKNPHVTYLVKNDSELQTLDDIAGHKVGIGGTGVCTDGYLSYYLNSKGLDASSVEYVKLPQGGAPEQAVVQGLIDVTDSHTPYATLALATGEVRVLGKTWDIFGSPAAGLGARSLPEWIIDEHPDVAQGFVDAMYRARLWSNANPEESANLMAAVLGLKEGEVLPLIQDENKNIEPSYIDLWFELAESEAVGLWETGQITPEEIYTNDFVPKDAPASDADLHWDGEVHNTY
ncbi:ABC transporter substrate-binding protein [Lachnospiraceae bacterium ZAX-1]